jgi:peptidoglycan/xylan/chitin deacetylase (PgdA/CDA1 family)
MAGEAHSFVLRRPKLYNDYVQPRRLEGHHRQLRKPLIIVSTLLALVSGLTGCGSSRPKPAPPHVQHVVAPSPPAQSKPEPRAAIVVPDQTPNPEPPKPKLKSFDPSPTPRFSSEMAVNSVKDSDREIMRAAEGGDRVAITFDAGASGAPTPHILEALASAHLHVTFFLTGKWCEENPELAKRILDEGHEIGNHTYSHPDLRTQSDEEIAGQIHQMNKALFAATGETSKPFFRPPFGAIDKRVAEAATAEGYGIVRWSLDSWDAWKKGITSDEIKERVLTKVKPGDIVLMHCGSQPTADELPELIKALEAKGLRIVTVSELIGTKSESEPTTRQPAQSPVTQ